MRSFLRALLFVLVIAGIAIGAIVYSITRRGLSARAQPTRAEEFVARNMRRLATPATVRSMKNPVPPAADVVQEGLEHFADHCAVCHGNNGSGDTDIGRGLYPRAPDMRAAATQELSDGELFSIIENGIRLSGMPAWGTGTPESERASWVLVHFIRRLPTLTDADIGRMEALNPKSAEQWREEEEARRSPAGEKPKAPTPHKHKHGSGR